LGLAAIWRGGFSYKKAGVMFFDLVLAASVQGGLFDAPDSPARQRLKGIIDRVNACHGRDTISFARSGRQRAWKLRSEHFSPRYTTSWEELLRVGSSDAALEASPCQMMWNTGPSRNERNMFLYSRINPDCSAVGALAQALSSMASRLSTRHWKMVLRNARADRFAAMGGMVG
ncbi:MAG: DUF4113 domain-containing protein, partial [Janthinobacterium lividum]